MPQEITAKVIPMAEGIPTAEVILTVEVIPSLPVDPGNYRHFRLDNYTK